MHKRKILIVGGGFGGVKAALDMCAFDEFEVTLLSENNWFSYHPTLYHTATGGSEHVSKIPLSEILKNKPVTIILGQATALHRKLRTVKTAGGETIHYDFLVLSLGAVTNYFGIKGMKEYSYGIKTIDEAEKLKAHLHNQLIDDQKPDLNYIIVGGGPTGVELAGALPAYVKKIMKLHNLRDRKLHIDLIEAAPRLMPRMPVSVSSALAKRLRKLGVKLYLGAPVQAETADALLVNGKPIRSHTVVWTAGIANHPFFANNNFMLAPNGRVQVDTLLQAWPGVFVIGDNADTPYSGMAQTALYDAQFVTHTLVNHLLGKPTRAYNPKMPFYVTPAGPGWATVVRGRLHLYGLLGWSIRQAANWIGYKDMEPWWKATEMVFAGINQEDSCAVCAASLAE